MKPESSEHTPVPAYVSTEVKFCNEQHECKMQRNIPTSWWIITMIILLDALKIFDISLQRKGKCY